MIEDHRTQNTALYLVANLGCQMLYCHTKNPNLGKFWRALEWKMLVYICYDHLEYFTAFWFILWPFGIDCCHLAYCFGMLGSRKIWQPWRVL
jgi:hypothetical protein